MELATQNALIMVDALAGNTNITVYLYHAADDFKYTRGPGWQMSDLESNRIIGKNQALKALELYNARLSVIPVTGKVDYVQRYWDITKSVVTDKNGDPVELCYPAMVINMNELVSSRKITDILNIRVTRSVS